MNTARAIAHSNIALVKYWGKRAAVPGQVDDLNLPAVGSLSMTLADLRTETVVGPGDSDSFSLNGEPIADSMAVKVFRHLDRIWTATGESRERPTCRVDSVNHLPTAAGLASSASGFAALTLAGAHALGLQADTSALSTLARRGSGSAARSLWGGFVRLDRGQLANGSDCRARPVFPADHWQVRLLIVHTTRGKKAVGSTAGMEESRQTSPYYAPWVDSSEADLGAAEAAIANRDLSRIGTIMEHSMFKMHACMLATRPPILYWNGVTLEVIRALWAARQGGLEAYATSDAGPHVKVLCAAESAPEVEATLRRVAGVIDIQAVRPGPDATVEILS